MKNLAWFLSLIYQLIFQTTYASLEHCDEETISLLESPTSRSELFINGQSLYELGSADILKNQCLLLDGNGNPLQGDDVCDVDDALATSLGDNTRSVGFFFDGTGNNHFLPDEPRRTSISYLYQAYNNSRGAKYYVTGVGTTTPGDQQKLISNEPYSDPSVQSWREYAVDWGAYLLTKQYVIDALGNSSGVGTKQRLDEALGKFKIEYDQGARIVDIFGFSRGAASARSFQNILLSEYDDVIVRFLGIFDTVAQIGSPSVNSEISWIAGYDLSINPATRYTAHAVAKHEGRTTFPLTSIQTDIASQRRSPAAIESLNQIDPSGHWQEKAFDGVHSDVGFGYDNGNKCAVFWMLGKSMQAGLEFLDTSSLVQIKQADEWHDSMERVFVLDKVVKPAHDVSRDYLLSKFIVAHLLLAVESEDWVGTRHVFPSPLSK